MSTISNTTGIIYTDCKGKQYTYNDILLIAKGNAELAEKLYEYCLNGGEKATIQNKFHHMVYEGIIDTDGNFLPNTEIEDIAQEIRRLLTNSPANLPAVIIEAFESITGLTYDANNREHLDLCTAAHKLAVKETGN